MKPTARQKRHMDRIREMFCITCGRFGVHAHHVVSDGFKRLSKNHERVVPLCPECHQYGPNAVHKIGHQTFSEIYGIDLMAEAERLWVESEEAENGCLC